MGRIVEAWRAGRFGIGRIGAVAALAVLLATAGLPRAGRAAGEEMVDTALIVSVDVSNSVDEERYRLQMDGIAKALEDPGVHTAILNGPQGAILLQMIQWADKPVISVPWTRIASREDAVLLAAKVRKLPRHDGEFTCMARMMRFVSDKIQPTIPAKAMRVVMDVSGDGIDNCNGEAPGTVRDELVAAGMIINGLPIHEADPGQPVGSGAFRAPGEPMKELPPPTNGAPQTLEPWYRENVIGGPGAFVLPAYGYNDFGRAIRQKFVVEISGLDVPQQPMRPALAVSAEPVWNSPGCPRPRVWRGPSTVADKEPFLHWRHGRSSDTAEWRGSHSGILSRPGRGCPAGTG